jgi:hypothetical protein
MNFFCRLLIWMFCTCFVVFRTRARERRHPIMFQYIPIVVIVVIFTSFAHARWKPEYGNMPPKIRAWYAQAQTMPDSRPRKEKGYSRSAASAARRLSRSYSRLLSANTAAASNAARASS